MEEEPKRLQATPEEFERMLRGETVSLSLEEGREYRLKPITINKIQYLNVESIEVSEYVRLTEFHKNILLGNNSKFQGISFDERAEADNVEVKCRIGSLSVKGSSKLKELRLSDNADIGTLNFYQEAFVSSVRLSRGYRVNAIWVQQKSIINNLLLNSGCVGEMYITPDLSVSRLIIEQSEISYLNISGDVKEVMVKKETEIRDCRVSGRCDVEKFIINNSIITSLRMHVSSSINTLAIGDGARVNVFSIFDNTVVNELKIIYGAEVGEIEIFGRVGFVEGIYISGATVKRKFDLHDLETNNIVISINGSVLPQRINFSNIKCNSLHFLHCDIDSFVQMVNVGPLVVGEGFLGFTQSTFLKLELISNQFDQFDYLSFTNCDFANAFIAETSFPRNIKSVIVREGVINYVFNQNQVKLFAEQFKVIHEKRGNRTEALKYQVRELDAHYNELNSGWDKATLFFNKWTTNYGTSWVQGVVSFFLVSFILYMLLFLFSWPGCDLLVDYGKWSSEFVEFMNPTSHIWKRWDYVYEINDLNPEKDVLSFGIKLWLFFSKVVIVSMIYQIVQAFRKFGKR